MGTTSQERTTGRQVENVCCDGPESPLLSDPFRLTSGFVALY